MSGQMFWRPGILAVCVGLGGCMNSLAVHAGPGKTTTEPEISYPSASAGASGSSFQNSGVSILATEPLRAHQATAMALSSLAGAAASFDSSLFAVENAENGNAVVNSAALLTAARSTTPSGSQDLLEALPEMLATILNDPHSIVTQEGNLITIDPSERNLCIRFADALADIFADSTQCELGLTRLIVKIAVHSDQNATLYVMFDGHELVVIDYSPDRVEHRADLVDLKAILVSLASIVDPGADPGLPETMEGKVRFAAQRLGPDHTRALLAVDEAINVQGTVDGQPLSLYLDVNPNALVAEANTTTGTVSLVISLQPTQALFPVKDHFGNVFPAQFDMPGLTLQATLTQGQMVAQNIGMGGQPLLLTVNGQTAIRLTVATFGFTTSDNAGTLTLAQAFDLDLYQNDVLGTGSGSGTLAIDAPSGTVFSTTNDAQGDVVKVASGGPLTVLGTGNMSAYLNAPAGTCFRAETLQVTPCLGTVARQTGS